jgi:hypothetical protein
MTPDSDSMAPGDQPSAIEQAMTSFLAGDPLRSIAAALSMGSYQTLRLLSTRVADRGEEQRSKALRNRCSAEAEVLLQNYERIWQLLDAGVGSSDIPKVLAAIGASIDIGIAVELLRSPEIFMEMHSRKELVELAPLTDTFSLLYVTARHRGLKPNYQFALGKIPMPGIDELRRSIAVHSSEVQTAEIVATVETVAEAVRTGIVVGISYSDYLDALTALAQEPDRNELMWLVPGPVVRNRLGGGFWSSALEAAGLTLPSTRARFTNADYEEASKAFRRAYSHFGSPKEVASYDSWVTAEAAAGRDRPSVIAIRRHFGTWESVMGAVMPSEVEDEFDGIVEMFKKENNLEYRWARAGELVTDALANMPWNSFLSIDYGDDPDGPHTPYAQASHRTDGVWCEIVSEQSLLADQWPIDTGYLLGNGWYSPDEEVPNWHKQAIPPIEAGHQILEGLKYGRRCDDPTKVRWHSGDFPGGPGPDGGLVVDDEPGGAVRNLRNGS